MRSPSRIVRCTQTKIVTCLPYAHGAGEVGPDEGVTTTLGAAPGTPLMREVALDRFTDETRATGTS